MKRIAIIVVMVLMSLTASATSIRYFTYPQAKRTVQYLNAQPEMMIYCGYDYEIETYVLINEVWMERINSSYYEIWVYGYDAYTGDEIYMPLDLQCVWLYSAGRMYNAAQYLRFHATVHTPSFAWYIPPYNAYTRRMHMAGYVRSYHYDIHRHGWMPPTPPHHGYGPHTQAPLPPYYMRTPQTPAPAPTHTWTPGVEHPQVNNNGAGSGTRSDGAVPTTRPSASGAATPGTTTRSGNARATESGTATTTRGTETRSNGNTGITTRSADNTTTRSTGTTTRSTATTPTRSNTGTTRSSGTETTTTTTRTGSTRSSGTETTTTTTRTGNTRSSGTATTTTTSRTGNTRSSGTTTSTTSTQSSKSTGSRSTSNRGTNTTTRK